MTQTQGVALPYICYIDVAQSVYFFQQFMLSAFFQTVFQFKRAIEVVLNSPLMLTGNNQELAYATGYCLFNTILNHRLVNNGQHLLWRCFCCRQKSCTKARCREDSFF